MLYIPSSYVCTSPPRHFLLQQCWQFDQSGRPTFSKLQELLQILSQNPANHITLKVSAKRKGYVADNGQVFLNPPPSSIIQRKLSTRALPSIETRQDLAELSTEDSGVDLFPSHVAVDQTKLSSPVEKQARKRPTSSLVASIQRSTHNSKVVESHLYTPTVGWTTQVTQDEDGEYRIVRSLDTSNPTSHHQELSLLLEDFTTHSTRY